MTNWVRTCRMAGAVVLSVLFAVMPLAPVRAADKPNCDDPMSQSEMTHCARLDFQAADRKLNATYPQVIRAMKEMDRDLPDHLKGAEQALRDAQRAWLVYRDKACASRGFIARGGSMEPMLVAVCLADLTHKRTQAITVLVRVMGRR